MLSWLFRAEPSRAEPSRAEPSRAEPSRAEPSRAEPSRAEPSRAEPSRAEPSRAEPSRAEPSRAEPSLGSCLSAPAPPDGSAAPAGARPSNARGPSGRVRHTRSASRSARALRTLAVFLIAFTALLAAPPAASAQTTVWSATLTAGESFIGTVVSGVGYDRVSGATTGSLDNNNFDLDGTTYTVTGLGILFPDSNARLRLVLDTALPAAVYPLLTLHLDSVSLSLGDGTVGTTRDQFEWTGHGLSWSNNDTISVSLTSTPPPAVSSVALTSAPGTDNTYAIGDSVTATVTFDAAVDITGTPELELDFNGTAKAAACATGTNTTTMACSYTVAVGDSAPNGVGIAANKLTGGTITATGSTVAADLDHSAVAIDAGHKVDGIRPTLVTTGDDAPTTSTDGTQVILTFSEDLSAADKSFLALTVAGAPGGLVGATVSHSGRTVTITLGSTQTIAAGETVTMNIAASAVQDAAGNANLSVSGSIAVINAVGVPTVSGVALTSAPGADSTYAIGDDVEATVTFSEAVDITGTPQLELDVAGTAKAAACATGTNTTTMACSYTVALNDSAPNGIAIAANTLTGGTITATGSTTATADLDHVAVAIDANHKVDGIRPTLLTTGTDAPTTSTDGTQVILTFSEDIGSATPSQFTIEGDSVALPTSSSNINVVGPTVELTLTTALTDSAASLTVALAVGAVTDAVGNDNAVLAATTVTNAVGSTAAPTVTGIALTSTPTYTAYHRGEDVEATVTFDAAVDITGTPQLELDFDGTAKAAACAAATNTTTMVCSYSVAGGDSAPNGIAIAANTLTGGTITATGSTTAADLDHSAVAIDAGHKVDGIRPTLVTTGTEAPTTSTDGTTVILTFSEDIRPVNRNLITIQANGVTLSTTAADRAGNKAELTLATALTAAATNLTVSLTSNSVFDAAGNGILAVAATAVTNAVDTPDPPGTLKARRGDGEVHLEWVPVAAVPTDPDLAYQLRYAAEGGEYSQWRDIPGSAPGGPNARRYTVTGLENGTRYAFELRVRRDSGFGTAAEIRQTPEAPRWSVSTNRRSVHEGEDVTLSIATRNAVGFYSAPEPLTLAVIGRIVLEFATIKGADPEDFEIRVGGTTVQGYTKDITFLNFNSDLDRDPFPAQHFDVEVPVGSTSLDVTVTVLADDDEEEGQEHMTFMVFRGEELVNADTWDGTGVNIESGDAGVVKQLAVADAEATEGEDPSLDFVVTLAPAAAWTVTVDYATHDGTARAGSDYTDTSGALTFAPGETAKTVSVPVIDDTVEDTPETLTVRLSNADPPYVDSGNVVWGSREAGVLIADAVATGTIRNTEDQAEPRAVSVSAASAAEGDSVVFTVSLSATSSQQVTVDYATADGTATAGEDYTATSGTLTFQAGETTKTISVPITDDTEDDGGETFTLTLSNASGADLGDAEATGTIRDTDTTATPLTASVKNLPATHDGSSEFTFQVEFSEDVGISHAVLRDDGFAVTKGEVTGARRVNGRNDLWQITVEPDGRDDVTITLPGHRNCGTTGAVCTRGDDPRPLSHSPSATVAGPEEDPAVTNTAATGAPTISGTPQVDETLTASVSGIADADGLDHADFAYQWIRGSADIEGATGSIYALVSADEGETITVRVSFTDDAENAESLTSAATDAVAAAPEPLTASFSGMPAEHAGEGTFSFGLTFSENVKLSYLTLRDAALSASGGAVRKAQRQQQGSNVGWDITVEPDSAGAVTIGLPGTTDCDAGGAICTADGRPLSHSLSATVAGPVGISVADARVEEAEGAQLAFVVTLSRAASGALTVDYATSDGSAQAGVDYTAASGTLTFRAGESSRTIEVAVLDDSHDDGGETVTLALSNPSGGQLMDGQATGTIENRDPLPRALLARFGRTAAVHVVEHVEERLQAPREPGVEGRFAGRALRPGMAREMALSVLNRLGGSAGAHPLGGGARGPLGGSPAGGMGSLGTPGLAAGTPMAAAGGPMGAVSGLGATAGPLGAAGPDGGLTGGGLLQMGLGGGDLLTGSAFAMNRETHGGILSFWSRGAQSNFSGREGALSLGGDVRTTMVGADYAKGPLVAGLSLSHSRGLGEYAGVAGGQVASSVTGLYPWLGYKATERVTVWGVAGYGAGGLRLTPQGGPALEAGLSMAMAAAGTRGELVTGGAGGFALAFKADALWCTSSNQSGPLRSCRKRHFPPLCRVVRHPQILSSSCL